VLRLKSGNIKDRGIRRGLEENAKCFGMGVIWGDYFEKNYINEGIPTDLKKDCTATIRLGLRIPSGHHIDCTEAPHLV